MRLRAGSAGLPARTKHTDVHIHRHKLMHVQTHLHKHTLSLSPLYVVKTLLSLSICLLLSATTACSLLLFFFFSVFFERLQTNFEGAVFKVSPLKDGELFGTLEHFVGTTVSYSFRHFTVIDRSVYYV